ncbi:MAG: hypothetical protein JOZ69_13960 [Myxococcales bacterium]|nr:hypothetical protein [Myxococcales bacterium]
MVVAILALGLGAGGPAACAPPAGAASAGARARGDAASVRAIEPRWEDAIDPKPALVVVVRPRRLRHDPVYGPLLARVIDLAREASRLVDATRALDAVEDAEELVISAADRAATAEASTGDTGDLVFVIRGVRADLDPGYLVADDGRPLWRPGPSGPVRELVLDGDAAGAASLFELPGRTWVIASGESRLRARATFGRRIRGALAPPELPAILDPHGDDDALAAAWLSGPPLLARVGVLRPPALLAPVGRHLETVTLSLSAGSEAFVRATLTYRDDEAPGPASARLREAIAALRGGPTSTRNEYAWLAAGAVTVDEAHRRVVVTAPLPKDVLAAVVLPGHGSSRSLPSPPSAAATPGNR